MRPQRPLWAMVGLAFAAAGCGGGPPHTKQVYAGEAGVLPAPSGGSTAPKLVLPPKPLTLQGRFPLNSVVSFNVPVRNDGSSALVIRKVDPG